MPKIKNESKNIQAFKQHGFIKIGESGDHVYGRCPFCGGDKFYINTTNKTWDCKWGRCGKSGGYQTFLQQLIDHTQQFFKQDSAIALHKDRGLKIATFREHKIGYNPFNKSYLVPVFDMTDEKIWNIRKYQIGGKLISTAGTKVGLYGWENIEKYDYETIWLCEGEWDRLAFWEILQGNDIHDELVLAVPGVNVFSAEWNIYFKDKIVNVLYDKGTKEQQKGAIKVYNNLKLVAKDLRFIHWPDSYEIGFDLRDFYKKENLNSVKTLKGVKSFLRELPPGIDFDVGENGEKKTGKEKYTGEGLHAEIVYKRYSKWLKSLDNDVLDVLYGVMIANQWEGDPLWLFLVGSPGSAKTELLMSLSDAIDVVTTTSLNPQTLVSGMAYSGGGDPSLIPKLNGKVLIIKDFTTILNMNPLKRDDIFGILRDAYDGKTEKIFGNGIVRSYKSKFGLIAGVTPAIEIYTEEHSALGERFLRFQLSTDPKELDALLKKAISNINLEDKMRKDLSNIGKEVLNFDFKNKPIVNEMIINKIINLAKWVSILRSTITREKYSGEITHKPFSELPTRLVKQFTKLLMGIAEFRRIKKATNVEYNIIKKIAIGTIPSRVENFIRVIYLNGKTKTFTIEILSQMIGLPSLTCTRIAEDLAMLKVLKRIRIKGFKSTEWQFTNKIIEIMERAEVYE